MRSYYAHLETATGTAPSAILPKPVFRSSAIFPVFQHPGISTRLIFLGYWILKRHIHEIACVVTLRSQSGEMLSRRNFQISEAKAYNIEAVEELEHAGWDSASPFTGSLEIEFFSTVNLFFPYPAVAVNYYGSEYSSVVHTAQRVYNDFEDMAKNSQTAVPESGFNIYADDEKEPFISFINGAEKTADSRIELQFINSDNEVLRLTVDEGPLLPYETRVLYPARRIDLKTFLKGKIGAGKAHFHLNWIFPRLVVGNIQKSNSATTITHTYYDCTDATSDSDYWRSAELGWNPASLMIPLTAYDDRFTNVYFYPIYSPSAFTVDVEIYDAEGLRLGRQEKAITIQSPMDQVISLRLKEMCNRLNIKPTKNLAARLVAHPSEGSRLPARIKLGLDVGASTSAMPCNICTNLQPFNPASELKPTSFKWAPLLTDHPRSTVWIMNSSPRTEYTKQAIVDLTFFRESDKETLTRQLKIAPHGFEVISPDDDPELKAFFGEKIGWLTATTTNAYTTTYYFSTSATGLVGGDHGF